MNNLKNLISKFVVSLMVCVMVVVGTSKESYAYSPDFTADNATGYVTIEGEKFYIEKTTLANGEVNVTVTDSNNVITEAKTFGDIVQIQEKEIVNGKKKVVSTQVFNTAKFKQPIKDTTKNVHANASKLVSKKQTSYGYGYYIYSNKKWQCYNASFKSKTLKYKSSTKTKLEHFRTSVNSARKYELKILASGSSALLGIAITVATAGAAAIIAAIVGGGGTLTLANYVIDYADALDDCKYYYRKL